MSSRKDSTELKRKSVSINENTVPEKQRNISSRVIFCYYFFRT